MGRPNDSYTPLSLPSPFQALSGLFWTCISRIKGLKKGLVGVSICLDVRKNLGLDEGLSFGNCMIHNSLHGDDLNGDEIPEASMAVKALMEEMNSKEIMDFIKWLECNSSLSSSGLNCGCDDHLICVNLEDVEPYSAVFEEGCVPIRVSYHVEPVVGVGQVLILPGPPEEGPLSRVVMVTLPDNEAVKLCEDVVVLGFSPTFLMGFNNK